MLSLANIGISSSMYVAGRILTKLYHETVVGSVYGKLARKMVVGAAYEQKVITDWITPKKCPFNKFMTHMW